MNTYKVQMYVKGTEEDAASLRKHLAQSVYDEFELGSVFGVRITLEEPPEAVSDRVMALCMVELETGLTEVQIEKLMSSLPADKEYMPIEFHAENASAYGFVEAEYYQIHDYSPSFFAEQIEAILSDTALETADGRYLTPDGSQFLLGYCND